MHADPEVSPARDRGYAVLTRASEYAWERTIVQMWEQFGNGLSIMVYVQRKQRLALSADPRQS